MIQQMRTGIKYTNNFQNKSTLGGVQSDQGTNTNGYHCPVSVPRCLDGLDMPSN